jgi:uncharacterized repeat protein (TIGR03803 family)
MIVAAIDIGTVTAQTDAPATGTVNFGTLDAFSGPDGGYPETGLIQATNGNLYGTTTFEPPISGGNGSSTIFEMTPRGMLTTVFAPGCTGNPCQDGDYPVGIVQANNGYIYGAMTGEGAYGAGTIFKMTPAGTFTTLYNFCPDATCDDGKFPVGLMQANSGDLYGTTQWGGLYNRGTVFKITSSGTFTSIYSFCLQEPCADGANPLAGLIQTANGDLVGTTEYGGTVGSYSSSYCPYGCGTVFKITPAGVLTTLHDFCSEPGCTDGLQPSTSLVEGPGGLLYGTTSFGGATSTCQFSGSPAGCGTIFTIARDGTFASLYSFCGQGGSCPDGVAPASPLVLAPSGDLYGTTQWGGDDSICAEIEGQVPGCGTVFKISPSRTFTTLHAFCAQKECPDGAYPLGLMESTSGIFYGTTYSGGGFNSLGTIFFLSTGEAAFVEPRPAIGSVGETVAIVGYGLKEASSVSFNGVPATIQSAAATVIYVKVPSGANTGKIQVVTPAGMLTSKTIFEVYP